MNREQYIANMSLEIDDNIARLVSKIDDDILEVWKIEKKDILEALKLKNEKEQLIEYLENMINKSEYEVEIKGNYAYISWVNAYKDILKKVRSSKYE